jgi:hypothetical protein
MAAKLNICNGADGTPVAAAIAQADALIDGNPIPMGVPADSPLGQQMVAIASMLDEYNNGVFSGPQCAEGSRRNEEPLASGGVDAVTLEQNAPNPFRPPTSLGYSLPAAGRARLAVYDLAGRLVKVLVDADQGAGRYSAIWDGTDERGAPVGRGIYFYRLQAGTQFGVRRMVMVR